MKPSNIFRWREFYQINRGTNTNVLCHFPGRQHSSAIYNLFLFDKFDLQQCKNWENNDLFSDSFVSTRGTIIAQHDVNQQHSIVRFLGKQASSEISLQMSLSKFWCKDGSPYATLSRLLVSWYKLIRVPLFQ